jgi:hypothetical protein
LRRAFFITIFRKLKNSSRRISLNPGAIKKLSTNSQKMLRKALLSKGAFFYGNVYKSDKSLESEEIFMKLFKKLILALLLVAFTTTTAFGFTDVQNHWSKDTVIWGAEKEIAKGFPDGTFKPDSTVTESQFLALLLRTFMDDVKDDAVTWYQPYYDVAHANNYPVIDKYNAVILRTQVAEIVSGTQGVNLSGDNAIAYLLAKGLAKGKIADSVTLENYYGQEGLTRAEALQFIKNVVDKGITEIKERPFEPTNPADVLTPEEKIKFDEILNSSEGITDVSQLTPALVETIKVQQELQYTRRWTIPEDKYYSEHVKAIERDLKYATYEGAETVVVSKDLFYVDDDNDKRYRIIVNGNELWDIGVGHNGKTWIALPGWKVSDNFNKGE